MKFQEWESKEVAEGRIDKEKIEYLLIPNHLEFENDELVIEGYPNLKKLIIFSCALKKVTINAPQLEILNLHDNQLKELDVSNTPLLETLTISENQNLSKIIGFENLNNLEELTCFKCKFENLNFSNKPKLKNIFAANQFVDYFSPNFQGAKNLEKVDVAENNIVYLDFSNLSKLKDVSCKEVFFIRSKLVRQNPLHFFKSLLGYIEKVEDDKITIKELKLLKEKFKNQTFYGSARIKVWENLFETNIENFSEDTSFSKEEVIRFLISSLNANFENCTSLERLNFSKSNIRNLNVNNCPSLQGVIGGWMNQVNDLDEEGNKQYITNPKTGKQEVKKKMVKAVRNLKLEPWYDLKFWRNRIKFPHLTLIDIDNDKANELEDLDYGERIYSYQQERAKENIQQGRHIYYGETHLDFSHHKFTSVNIDGKNYGSAADTITSINLGDNYLYSLKMANFPNLERLIISHNTSLNEETLIIENCPKLDKNSLLFYHYKSNDETRTPPPDAREYDEERDNPFKKKQREEQKQKEIEEKLNQQVRDILAKKEEEITFEELLNLFIGKLVDNVFDSLEKDIQDKFKNLFKRKLRIHIEELINNYSEEKRDEFIKEINSLSPFFQYLDDDIKQRLNNLVKSIQQEYQVSRSSNLSFPFYLIFIVAFLRIGFLLFGKKKRENYFEKI